MLEAQLDIIIGALFSIIAGINKKQNDFDLARIVAFLYFLFAFIEMLRL